VVGREFRGGWKYTTANDGLPVPRSSQRTVTPRRRPRRIDFYATVEVAREALVKGAFDFIAKPFLPRELTAVVNKAALSLGHNQSTNGRM
jgi:CheY-like chemotaxis protein